MHMKDIYRHVPIILRPVPKHRALVPVLLRLTYIKSEREKLIERSWARDWVAGVDPLQ